MSIPTYHGAIPHGKSTFREVEAIKQWVQTHTFGDTITHAEIEELIGVNRKQDPSRYRSVICQAKKTIFAEMGIMLLSVRGVGYCIPEPNEQVDYGVGCFRGGVRWIARAGKVIQQVPQETLPENDRKIAAHIGRAIHAIAGSLGVEVKKIQAINRNRQLPLSTHDYEEN